MSANTTTIQWIPLEDKTKNQLVRTMAISTAISCLRYSVFTSVAVILPPRQQFCWPQTDVWAVHRIATHGGKRPGDGRHVIWIHRFPFRLALAACRAAYQDGWNRWNRNSPKINLIYSVRRWQTKQNIFFSHHLQITFLIILHFQYFFITLPMLTTSET